MKAHYTEYLNEMLKSYRTERETAGRIQFIRCYSSFGASGKELSRIVKNSEVECDFLYHEFSPDGIQTPYEPFIEWIRDVYKDRPGEEFDKLLEKTGVYSLHKSLLKSYIYTGVCKRSENIIISECEYEKKRFLESLINMVNYIWRERPVIMVLHALNFAQSSTIEFLMKFIYKKGGNISVLSGYSEMNNDAEYMQHAWTSFVQEIELNNMLVECGMDDGYFAGANMEFASDDRSTEKYIMRIFNLNSMFAYDEAGYYIEHLYHKLFIEQSDISDRCKKRIFMLYAYVALCNGDTKTAFLKCKNLKDMPNFEDDPETLYIYNYLTALIMGNGGQWQQAYHYIDECRDIAGGLGNKDYEFDAELLRYMVMSGNWWDPFTWQKKMKISQDFLEEMEKRHQYNHLSYIYFQGFSYVNIGYGKDGAGDYDESFYFRKALRLAEIVGNRRSVFFALHKLIILASTNGKFEKIDRYYENCLEICRKEGRKEDEAEIYHGQGYFHMVLGKYDLADMYFKKSVEIILETKNPTLLMEALYNMTMNSVAVEQYEDAVFYINFILRAMKMLKMERLRICNISKLYGLLTVAYIKLGKIYDAKLYIDKMKLVLSHITDAGESPDYSHWEDDIFLYYMVLGMIHMNEGEYDEANAAFEENLRLLELFDGKQDYILPQFAIEITELYERIGNTSGREEIYDRTINFIRKRGYIFQTERLEKYRDGVRMKWSDGHLPISGMSAGTMQDIYEIVGRAAVELELEEKNKALVFFENWVDLINRENATLESVVENAMLTMQNMYDLDAVMWIEDDGWDIPAIIYKSGNIKITLKQVTQIVDYFNERRKWIVVKRSEKSFQDNKNIVDIFDGSRISSFVGIPIIAGDRVTNVLIGFRAKRLNFIMNGRVLTENDSAILRTAFRQLLDARNREMFKLSLEKNSVTDILTGLYNRQGMKKYLEEQLGKRRSDIAKVTFTILYLDLDNFKYCNDNFGHDVGDAVLIAFSEMLKNIVGNRGGIIRYGGDEFVILLTDMPEDEGVRIARNIFFILEKNKGFKDDISSAYGKTVSIEKENRVSCSVGIASGKCRNQNDVIGVLRNADKALYEVKRNTKHDFMVSK